MFGLKQFTRNFHVSVVGAAGGIGQPLSLLLKQNPLVTKLSLYDLSPTTPGVAADLSHIDSKASVAAFSGNDLDQALKAADVIVIPAGVPRKPGMTRDDLFSINASIVANIAKVAATAAPNACILVISNPVNSTVPIIAETLKKAGAYNKAKLMGVTTLDVVRANRFLSEKLSVDPATINVPVIGGHAGVTIIPLLSQVKGADKLSQDDIAALTKRIMFGGDEVVKAKAGTGSATLSMAYAGARFANSVLRGLNGEKGVKECAYVESPVVQSLDASVTFFSSPVTLGKNGVEAIDSVDSLLNTYERKLQAEALPELKSSIQKGVEFVKKN